MSDCQTCGGSGLLPFRNKDGKLIPHTWVYCTCYQEKEEHFSPISPDDIDYPVSYSYYRSLCQHYGWPDPGPLEPPEHDLEELHERILALEERPQIIERSGVAIATPPKETEPRLHGGVSL